jgi:PadR family transcriptional regulator PadR
MKDTNDIWQGTLAIMVLRTLDTMGPQHGYGLASRIEQISGNRVSVNHGTLYPVLIRLEQERAIKSAWGVSENNRRARFYRITPAGRRRLAAERGHWRETTEILALFFGLPEES